METCVATKKDGTRCKGKPKGDSEFCVFHLKEQAVAPAVPAPSGAPAKLKGLHQASEQELVTGHRSIKMVRPICAICAPNVERAGHGWWNKCPHDPYVGERGEVIEERTYEDELDADGNVVGRVVTGTQSRTVLRPWPNFVPVSMTKRINSGRGPEFKAALYGYVLPQDLRTKSYPNGIAPMCEFHECYSQDNLREYENGVFCREAEAVIVYEDISGTVVEVANNQIREDQFALNRSKVRALS